MKENKLSIIIIIILCLIIGLLTGYIIFNKKNNPQPNNNEQQNTETNKKEEDQKKLVLKNNEHEDSFKIEIDSKGNLIVNTDILKDKIIDTNVDKAYVLYHGTTDIGDGRVILMIKNDKTISAFNMEYITTVQDIKNESDFNKEFKLISNLSSYKNIIEAYNEKYNSTSQYEPPTYKVFIKDTNNNIIDITSYLEFK